MNKTLFYLIVTVVGLVTLSLIWFPAMNQSESTDGATPAAGLVGNTTEEAVGKDAEETPAADAVPADTQETPAAPSDALAPAPAETVPADSSAPAMDAAPAAEETTAPAAEETAAPAADEVPAGAEVSGEAPAAEETTPAPAAEEVPAEAPAPAAAQ